MVPKRTVFCVFGPNFWAQFSIVPSTRDCENFNDVNWKVKSLAQKKNLWASDSVNRHSTSKCEILYSFFTKIDSGRIFARLLFHFQRWLGCENQQAGTKPSIDSCLKNFRCCYDSNRPKIMAQNLINFCHLKKWEFSKELERVFIQFFICIWLFCTTTRYTTT